MSDQSNDPGAAPESERLGTPDRPSGRGTTPAPTRRPDGVIEADSTECGQAAGAPGGRGCSGSFGGVRRVQPRSGR